MERINKFLSLVLALWSVAVPCVALPDSSISRGNAGRRLAAATRRSSLLTRSNDLDVSLKNDVELIYADGAYIYFVYFFSTTTDNIPHQVTMTMEREILPQRSHSLPASLFLSSRRLNICSMRFGVQQNPSLSRYPNSVTVQSWISYMR